MKKLFALMLTALVGAALVTAPMGCGDKKTETKPADKKVDDKAKEPTPPPTDKK